MPVRSLLSSVLRWPDDREVRDALSRWTARAAAERNELVRVGYIGSYARGDWGPGSDLDVVLVVAHAREPFIERGRSWDLTSLPVPADVLVYTETEFQDLARSESRFGRLLREEAVWVLPLGTAATTRERSTRPTRRPS